MRYYVIVFVLILCVNVFAFDENPELTGTIHRPGSEMLETKVARLANSNHTYIENQLTGTPKAFTIQYYSPYSPANPQELVNDFLNNNRVIFSNDAADFRITSTRFLLNKFYFISLVQTYQGVDIWGSRLGIRATPAGKIFFAGGETYTGIDLDITPGLSLDAARSNAISGIPFNNAEDKITYDKPYVLPLIFKDKIEYHLCYLMRAVTKEPLADWQIFVDAHSGEVLWREDVTRYETISGNISGYILPDTPYDTPELQPYPHMEISSSGSPLAYTDADGNYSFDVSGQNPINLDLLLQGLFINVNNEIAPDSWFNTDVNPGETFDLQWTDDNSTMPERNAYYHGQIVHDFIKTIDPDLEVMDFPMTCRVNVDGNCNAFYSNNDRSINFYEAGANCPNIALIGDVIYHEWGHGLTNLTYYYGGHQDPNGAMHEGFSDFLACLITDQPWIGRGFYGPGSHLRSVDNNNRYPEDWSGESHNDGLIISGALWDLKGMLEPDRPGYIDTLWQFAKYGFSRDFDGYFWDVLTVDDDDGDLDNGTPHAYEIYHCFGDLHGIGPGVTIDITHTPINDSEDSTVTYQVEAHVTDSMPMDQGSVTLYYSTGGPYVESSMSDIGDNDWQAVIPNQSFGTTVNYYIGVRDNLNLVGYSPENAPDSVYTFFVGFDIIPPVLTDASGPANTINLFGPYGPFSFSASDNHGIDMASGELHYKINNGQEVTIAMPAGDQADQFMLDDINVGRVLATGDIISYYFSCRDEAINPNTGRMPESGYFNFEISTEELVGDFEGGLGDWVIQSDGWVYFDHQGYQSSDCIKTGDTFYADDLNSIIYLARPLNLSLFYDVQLNFMSKHVIESGDTCFVIASNSPDGPWTRFLSITGSASTWRQYIAFLDAMTGPGNEEVYVGFQFISDGSDNSVGILVDRVTLSIDNQVAIEPETSIPSTFSLAQNHPNPFNLQTLISFALPSNSKVKLEIFDILGRQVRTVIDNVDMPAGLHQVIWDGKNANGEVVTSGVYFYRLDHNGGHEIKTMTLLK